jgi:hypothetical protein
VRAGHDIYITSKERMLPLIGFLMTVGPGEGDIGLDAIHAILRLYPDTKIWIRDDATSDGTFDKLKRVATENPDQIDLVRNPCALGLSGIPVSIFRSFERVCRAPEKLEMLIQLDPDVWLQGGVVEFARDKFATHGPGIIGSYMRSPTQALRSHTYHRNNMLRDLLPCGRDRVSKRIRIGLPFYVRYLPAAFKRGYRMGHHVLAAFYIVHGHTLYALDRIGFWGSMPDVGSRAVKEDDPLVSIGPYIVGHKLIEVHDEGTPRAWLQYKNPLPLSAMQILDGGYVAVHPLKHDEQGLRLRSELRLRTPA